MTGVTVEFEGAAYGFTPPLRLSTEVVITADGQGPGKPVPFGGILNRSLDPDALLAAFREAGHPLTPLGPSASLSARRSAVIGRVYREWAADQRPADLAEPVEEAEGETLMSASYDDELELDRRIQAALAAEGLA